MATTVKVDYDALKAYLHDYHHNSRHNRCKADGQDWPCDVYKKVYFAVHGREPVKRSLTPGSVL